MRGVMNRPHLAVGESERRHDLGDELARRHGVRIVAVACGREEVPTTLATRRPDLVRCPECVAEISAANEPECGHDRARDDDPECPDCGCEMEPADEDEDVTS